MWVKVYLWYTNRSALTLEYRIRVPARLLVQCQNFQQALLLNTKNDTKKLGTIIKSLRIFLKALLFMVALLFGTQKRSKKLKKEKSSYSYSQT